MQEFIDKAETFRPVINELNDRSHDLDREAAEKSRQLINELMTNVNSRWKDLVGQTENKQMILQVGRNRIDRKCSLETEKSQPDGQLWSSGTRGFAVFSSEMVGSKIERFLSDNDQEQCTLRFCYGCRGTSCPAI